MSGPHAFTMKAAIVNTWLAGSRQRLPSSFNMGVIGPVTTKVETGSYPGLPVRRALKRPKTWQTIRITSIT